MTKIIRGIVFDHADRELVERALGPYKSVLGVDEKERERVGRHVHRIVDNAGGAGAGSRDEDGHAGEPYFEDDLRDLLSVVQDLEALFAPQVHASWWREQGAPGADDAVEGLAEGRSVAVENLETLRGYAVEWLAQVQGVLA